MSDDSDDDEDVPISSLGAYQLVPAVRAKSPSGSSPSSSPATSSDDDSGEDDDEELSTEVPAAGPSPMDEDTSISLRRVREPDAEASQRERSEQRARA